MAKQKTAAERILSALKRAPKKGLTAEVIAERTGVQLGTVRSYLYAFKADGQVAVAGKVETGKRGRPALTYVSA